MYLYNFNFLTSWHYQPDKAKVNQCQSCVSHVRRRLQRVRSDIIQASDQLYILMSEKINLLARFWSGLSWILQGPAARWWHCIMILIYKGIAPSNSLKQSYRLLRTAGSQEVLPMNNYIFQLPLLPPLSFSDSEDLNTGFIAEPCYPYPLPLLPFSVPKMACTWGSPWVLLWHLTVAVQGRGNKWSTTLSCDFTQYATICVTFFQTKKDFQVKNVSKSANLEWISLIAQNYTSSPSLFLGTVLSGNYRNSIDFREYVH